MRFGIGKSAHRVEDRRFLTGEGRYVGDIDLPGQCHGALVLSIHAHARLVHVDTTKALVAPGVRCVLTGADAVADGLGGLPPLFLPEDIGLGPKGYRSVRPILVADKVRCVGDRVAFVVADTAAQARDAADLVEVIYEPLPAVIHPDDALTPGAPALHDDNPGNECCRVEFGNAAATDAAFGGAAHVVTLDIENQRLTAMSIEPRCAIGYFDRTNDFYTLYTSSQNPHGVRQMVAGAVFHLPEEKFRVVSPDVGGGFGMKADAYPDDALVLWASRRCGRPVKWVPTRSEALAADNHGRDQAVHGELALDDDGKILAARVRSRHGIGAYVVSAGAQPPMLAVRLVPSVYQVPAYHGTTQAVFTNTSPSTVYRGAGRPEAAFLMERLLDLAAAKLGIDADEIRRRNLIVESQMPYATQTGFVYDSGDFSGLLDRCRAAADWSGFEQRRVDSATRGLLRGRSVAFFIEFAGIFNDRMEIRFNPSGTATILAGTHSHGQGHATTFAQLVAEWLGIPFESIRYVQGDTDAVAYGRGTYAARSSLLASGALREACDIIIDKAKRMAAHLMEAAPEDIRFDNGMLSVAGSPDRAMPLSAAAKAFFAPAGMPRELGVGLEAVGTAEAAPPNFPNGCHICEVEVDPETGFVRIDRYTAIDDVGLAINPEICEGQIHGGLAQGIGQALFEHVAYDRESGQLLSGTLLDYTCRQQATCRRATPCGWSLRRSLPYQRARHQGRRGVRSDRGACRRHERNTRRLAAAGRDRTRNAGDSAASMGSDRRRSEGDVMSGLKPGTITGIDAVIFGVIDVAEAERFATDWGLVAIGNGMWQTVDGSEIGLLAADDSSLPAPIEPGSTTRRLIWSVADAGSLGAVEDELAKDRAVTVASDGTVWSVDDLGLAVGFRVSRRQAAATEPYRGNGAGFSQRVGMRAPFYDRATPHEISHVVFGAPDLDPIERFYVDRLGFTMTDRYRGRAVFLRASPAGNHHHMFVLNSADGAAHFNHVCFKVRDVHEVIGGGQHIVAKGWKSQAGPGRHYVSSAVFWYFHSPWGGAAEYATDEDVVSADWVPNEYDMSPEIFTEWRFNLPTDRPTSMPIAASTTR